MIMEVEKFLTCDQPERCCYEYLALGRSFVERGLLVNLLNLLDATQA